MSRKGAFRIACALAGAAGVLAPVQVSACIPIVQIKVEPDGPPDFSDWCRAALRDPDAFVSNFGSVNHVFIEVVTALRDGSARCPKRPDHAFALLDKAIGSPLHTGLVPDATDVFLAWAPDDLSPERSKEVRIGAWILSSTYVEGFCSSGYYSDRVPDGFGEDEIINQLVSEAYWHRAVGQFGNNPERDRLVLRQLIDPTSARFNLSLAKELVPKSYGSSTPVAPDPIYIEVAEAVADPRLGVPDYEAAAAILEPISYYVYTRMDDTQSEGLLPLWTRIAQTRLTQPDPEIRRAALFMLATGDPWARPGMPFESRVPEGFEVIQLDEWPSGLEPLRNLERSAGVIAEQYPSRALRAFESGQVELGILFGPDGRFRSIHLYRSVSDILDYAAQRGAERYFRPRLKDMVLEGYAGQYVYVPLPAFDYRISTNANAENRGLSSDGKSIVITAQPIRIQ